jgi:hypothetical protein
MHFWMGHWRNMGRNLKIPIFKWKLQHNLLEPVGYSKNSGKEKVYNHECTLKIIINEQLMMYLKLLEK